MLDPNFGRAASIELMVESVEQRAQTSERCATRHNDRKTILKLEKRKEWSVSDTGKRLANSKKSVLSKISGLWALIKKT